jgi:hypothetical protein
VCFFTARPNIDKGSGVRAAVLDGVADEILEKLLQLGRVNPQRGQRPGSYLRATRFYRLLEIGKSAGKRFTRIDRHGGLLELRYLGKVQQVTHQKFHPARARRNKIKEVAGVSGQVLSVSLSKEFTVDLDAPQRFLQVVAGGISELLEVLIGSQQLLLRPLALCHVSENHPDPAFRVVLQPE